ncbi:MAG TPA: nuclear transport factor 2 family protein [Eoetvoesiella sp.]
MFATPEEASNAFYDALQHANLSRMMSVWADDEEIACIHPNGARVIGLAAVKGTWQTIFNHGPVLVAPSRPLIMTTVMSSVHVLIEQLEIDTPEGLQIANCYTTNIFHKGRSGWRMVLHHASNAPVDARLFDLQDIPDTLH